MILRVGSRELRSRPAGDDPPRRRPDERRRTHPHLSLDRRQRHRRRRAVPRFPDGPAQGGARRQRSGPPSRRARTHPGARAGRGDPTSPTLAAPPVVAPAPVEEAEPASSDDWADAADWDIETEAVVDFPIADYDELRLEEILPLLPQLYSDELDLVYEREANGQRRTEILDELDRLKETGTEADALEQAAVSEAVTPEPTPAPEVVEPAPVPPRPTAPATTPFFAGDDDDDLFPIADYDDLSVSQIMPLLSQLELDELEDVRAREVAGANRSTLVTEIDRYLSGELEAFTWDDDVVEEPAEPEAPVPVVDPEAARLPIADYPQLNVAEVNAQLDGLTGAQLEQVRDFEAARDNRAGIVSEIDRRLSAAPPAQTRRSSRRSAATSGANKAPSKKAPSKKAQAKKAPSKRASAAGSRTTKAATKKSAAKKSAAKKTAAARRVNHFPIEDYDTLTVAAIRPRLRQLDDAQLRQVRERELTGAGRKTILSDIDNRLS